jgi:hypothetical protein
LSFKENNPAYSNLILNRTFRRNLLKFWNWYNYLTNEQYDYEFQKEINQAFNKPL